MRRIELDVSQEWVYLRSKKITISEFLLLTIRKMEKLQGTHHVNFGRWIHHFRLLVKDRRFNGWSASGLAKFDSVWEAFEDFCYAHGVQTNTLYKVEL